MLQFIKGQDETLILTLNEKRTLEAGYYLLLFTHYTTKETVTKIYNFIEDESSYPDRFNQFPLLASVFLNATRGMWQYKVYEQASAVNTDPDGLTEVEAGIMVLSPSTDFEFEENTAQTSFKVYNG